MLKRDDMLAALSELLQPERFRDYCPNGLQVEGRERIQTLVTGVTACQALLDAAIIEDADAILVHHGYFWRNEAPQVTGMRKQRLLRHDISLFAYHLPLDAHPTLGNNARLGDLLGLRVLGGLDADDPDAVGLYGSLPESIPVHEFLQQVEDVLGRSTLHIGEPLDLIESVAWCTGAAQGYIEKAQALGVDLYLSGEISEATTHFARETGIHYVAAGHHATERYGVQAVGDWLAEQFGIRHIFVDIDNPV